MIKSLIDKILKPRSGATGRGAKVRIPTGKRVEVPQSEHGIDASLVDDRAIRVVETLQNAGYEAYIVGGAVRDLLLGHRPKDFDVATNATPEQVKSLFRRAFIIGRRFRIVHVVFGRGRENDVIEVSTFRAYLDPNATVPFAWSKPSKTQATRPTS
jgi:poly(A) polymerase